MEHQSINDATSRLDDRVAAVETYLRLLYATNNGLYLRLSSARRSRFDAQTDSDDATADYYDRIVEDLEAEVMDQGHKEHDAQDVYRSLMTEKRRLRFRGGRFAARDRERNGGDGELGERLRSLAFDPGYEMAREGSVGADSEQPSPRGRDVASDSGATRGSADS